MTPEELRDLLKANEPPYVIRTIGGRSYTITARSTIWTPDTYPMVVCLAPTGKGIAILKIATIESIHVEHPIANAR